MYFKSVKLILHDLIFYVCVLITFVGTIYLRINNIFKSWDKFFEADQKSFFFEIINVPPYQKFFLDFPLADLSDYFYSHLTFQKGS